MTAQELLDSMVEAGCCAEHIPTATLHGIAVATVQPDAVAWATVFPLDQHHTHRTPYTRLQIYHGRDLAVWQGKRMELYFAPAEEWPGLDLDYFREEVVRWRQYLADPANRAAFDAFLVSQEV